MNIDYSKISIIEDSRNKINSHDNKNNYFKKMGIRVLRSKLPFGDYAIVDNMSITVDTKMSMLEIESNLTKDHIRFRKEITNANSFGIGLVILIEETIQYKNLDDVAERYEIPKWQSTAKALVNGQWVVKHKKGEPKGKFEPKNIIKAMKTMQEKYAVLFVFTTPETCGRDIIDILINKREMLDKYFNNKLKEINKIK